jgi:hypothetical protein
MEPGRIDFIDEDGSSVPLDRRDDELDVRPSGTHHGRWQVLALAAVILAVCGGVLWQQHSGTKPAAAPVKPTAPSTVVVDPETGDARYGGVRPTGELLAEAETAQRRLQCMRQAQLALAAMSTAYRSALAAGGSLREAERAARAALADGPTGGGSGPSYDAMFRIWLVNQTALSRLSGERLSFDMTGLCPG